MVTLHVLLNVYCMILVIRQDRNVGMVTLHVLLNVYCIILVSGRIVMLGWLRYTFYLTFIVLY